MMTTIQTIKFGFLLFSNSLELLVQKLLPAIRVGADVQGTWLRQRGNKTERHDIERTSLSEPEGFGGKIPTGGRCRGAVRVFESLQGDCGRKLSQPDFAMPDTVSISI